jgi:hypothetical protein
MGDQRKEPLNQAASQMGSRGGKSGKGLSKRRGNVSYYRDMQRKSVASRLKNAAAKNEKKTKN